MKRGAGSGVEWGWPQRWPADKPGPAVTTGRGASPRWDRSVFCHGNLTAGCKGQGHVQAAGPRLPGTVQGGGRGVPDPRTARMKDVLKAHDRGPRSGCPLDRVPWGSLPGHSDLTVRLDVEGIRGTRWGGDGLGQLPQRPPHPWAPSRGAPRTAWEKARGHLRARGRLAGTRVSTKGRRRPGPRARSREFPDGGPGGRPRREVPAARPGRGPRWPAGARGNKAPAGRRRTWARSWGWSRPPPRWRTGSWAPAC